MAYNKQKTVQKLPPAANKLYELLCQYYVRENRKEVMEKIVKLIPKLSKEPEALTKILSEDLNSSLLYRSPGRTFFQQFAYTEYYAFIATIKALKDRPDLLEKLLTKKEKSEGGKSNNKDHDNNALHYLSGGYSEEAPGHIEVLEVFANDPKAIIRMYFKKNKAPSLKQNNEEFGKAYSPVHELAHFGKGEFFLKLLEVLKDHQKGLAKLLIENKNAKGYSPLDLIMSRNDKRHDKNHIFNPSIQKFLFKLLVTIPFEKEEFKEMADAIASSHSVFLKTDEMLEALKKDGNYVKEIPNVKNREEYLAFTSVIMKAAIVASNHRTLESGGDYHEDEEIAGKLLHSIIKNSEGGWKKLDEITKDYTIQNCKNVGDMVKDCATYIALPLLAKKHKSKLLDRRISKLGKHDIETVKNAVKGTMATALFEGYGLNRILKLSKEWHNRRNGLIGPAPKPAPGEEKKNCICDFEPMGEWYTLTKDKKVIDVTAKGLKGYKIENLTNGKRLKKEGDEMKNCIAGLADSCMAGDVHAFAIKDAEGNSISNFDISIIAKDKAEITLPASNKGLRINNHEGFHNEKLPADAKKVLSWFKREISSGRVEINTYNKGEVYRGSEGESLTSIVKTIGFKPTTEKRQNAFDLIASVRKSSVQMIPNKYKNMTVDEFLDKTGLVEKTYKALPKETFKDAIKKVIEEDRRQIEIG